MLGLGTDDLFSIDQITGEVEQLHSFGVPKYPQNSLVLAGGKLWGASQAAIYRLDLDENNFDIIQTFDDGFIYGDLLVYNEKVWGVSSYGGENGTGFIFNVNEDGSGFQVLYHFKSSNNDGLKGGLSLINSKFWGTCLSCGASGAGLIYSIDSDGISNYSIVHQFNGTDGSSPVGELIESNNKIWGVTTYGGIFFDGTIFNLELDGTGFATIFDFSNNDSNGNITGRYPKRGLKDIGGRLWGSLNNNGNYIYSLSNDGSNIVMEFTASSGNGVYSGDGFSSELIESNSKIWGVSSNGSGSFFGDPGFIFNMDLDGTNFSIVHEFNEVDGSTPYYSLTEVGEKLYGVTIAGGLSNYGVVFSINSDETGFEVVSHLSNEQGSDPKGSLLQIGNSYYGVGYRGGIFGEGIVYSVSDNGSNYSVLHHFDGEMGASPRGFLTLFDEKLWGVTEDGGEYGYGTVYSINPDGSGFMVYHHFDNSDGRKPFSGVSTINGRLWGTTYLGGLNDHGTIYTIDIIDGFSKIHDFNSPNGRNPEGRLVLSEGSVFGVTQNGGANNGGTIFSLNLDGSEFDQLYDFESATGTIPSGDFIVKNSILWGTCSTGGSSSNGTIFSFDLAMDSYTVTHSFDNSNGRFPQAGLIESNGLFWGVTAFGGVEDEGIVFSFDPYEMLFENIAELGLGVGLNPRLPLTKVKEDPAIAFDLSQKQYGDDPFQLTIFSFSDANVEFESSDNTILSIIDNLATIHTAGEVVVTANQEASSDYQSGILEETLIVTQAPLTITAEDKIIDEGEPLPEFTTVFSGFVLGDDVEDIDELPLASVSITNTNMPGVYEITLSGGSDNNYSFSLINGELLIEDVLGLIKNYNVLIYPNPVINSFQLNSDSRDIESVSIYDLKGERLMMFNEPQSSYDISTLPFGAYILLVQSDSQLSIVKIFK